MVATIYHTIKTILTFTKIGVPTDNFNTCAKLDETPARKYGFGPHLFLATGSVLGFARF
jgi:hypothetical protein